MKIDKQKVKSEILSYIFIFLGVFGFKSTFFEPNHIPSGSMLPTMAIGDFIIVNKFAYGFKVPFSEWFSDPIYITDYKEPKRGDIVVFEYPKDRSTLFVKRLVGLPGETIEVVDNQIFINGEPFQRNFVENIDKIEKYKALYDEKGFPLNLKFFETQTRKDLTHIVAHNDIPFLRHMDQEKVTIPEGHYFMMGDNRDFSSDSRRWGFVPQTHIRGKALFVWFNMVYPWSSEPFHFRPWRIGTTFY